MFDQNLSRLANICTICGFLCGVFSENILAIIICGIIVLFQVGFYLYVKYYRNNKVIKHKKMELLTLLSPINKKDNIFLIKSAIHKCLIEGERAKFIYTYEGVCTVMKGEECIVFNIGAEEYIPFEKMECYAYDLINDANKVYAIKPELLGDDGLTKKIKIKFLKKLQLYEQFKIEFTFVFPHCVKWGRDYITFTTSYSKQIHTLKNILVFKRVYPETVELYKIMNGEVRYERTICPQDKGDSLVYVDCYEECQGKQVFIYFFDRGLRKEG